MSKKKKPVKVRVAMLEGQAWCMQCRAAVGIIDPRPVTFKNGRKALKGVCLKKHVIFRMLPIAPK